MIYTSYSKKIKKIKNAVSSGRGHVKSTVVHFSVVLICFPKCFNIRWLEEEREREGGGGGRREKRENKTKNKKGRKICYLADQDSLY